MEKDNDNDDYIDPQAPQNISFLDLCRKLVAKRQLILQLTKREVVGRYRGSILGLAWSFFNPVFMLAVYTFVFSIVFKARWGGLNGSESKTMFALVLFVGMIMHGILAEVMIRSSALILGNVNYVKKVIFPLEILPVVCLGATLFHSMVSLTVLLLAFFLFNGFLHPTFLLIPVVMIPLLILTMGISWFLASLGVFLRDVGQVVGILTTVLLFLSPVFYPISAVPEELRPFIMLNPLSFIIEEARKVLIYGELPNFIGLAAYSIIAIGFFWSGYAWFQKTRKGFADVL